MQQANPRSVLGNFNHATFSNLGVTSRFFRRGAKFMARTDGPDGRLHDYEINYAFGVYPLQQYRGTPAGIGHRVGQPLA